MANLLEETRNLMPGRARSHWNLTEASEDDDFEYELQQTQDMIERLNKAQPRFHAELKRLSGYDGWMSHGTGVTHGRVFVPFSTFARIGFILNHVDKKTGVIRMYRVDVEVSPRHRGPNDVREVYMQVHGTIRSQKDPFNREKDVEFNRTFSFDLGKGKKSDRYDDPKVVLAKAGPVFDEANRMMPKGMGESLDEMAAADAALDWKGAAEKLLPKRTGKGQDDLHYRAYLRAIIAGNQAQATHLAKQFKPARDARRDLIDAVGLGESVEGYNVASKGVEKALRRAKYFEGDAEKTASSIVTSVIENKAVMEYLWGLPKHVRSESFLRDLIKFPIQKWLRSQDGDEDPEMRGLVDEVLPMLIPSARSDAATIRKHVRFAGMREGRDSEIRNPFVSVLRDSTGTRWSVGFRARNDKLLWWTGKGLKNLLIVPQDPKYYPSKAAAEADIEKTVIPHINKWAGNLIDYIRGWEVAESILGRERHMTAKQWAMVVNSGRGIWGNPNVIESMRFYAEKAAKEAKYEKYASTLSALADAIEAKDSQRAAKLYNKLPSNVSERFVVVAVRELLGESVTESAKDARGIVAPIGNLMKVATPKGESIAGEETPALHGFLAMIKVGSILEVERQPVYSRRQPPSNKVSKKKVTWVKVAKRYDGEPVLHVSLSGMEAPSLMVSGNPKIGYRLTNADKPPLKYTILTVDGRDYKHDPNWKKESITGVPGAFAISDAPAPTPQDQVADLLDRVRNPRWEYPSWALPKVKLDEEPDGVLDEARLSSEERRVLSFIARNDELPISAFKKKDFPILDKLKNQGFIRPSAIGRKEMFAQITQAGRDALA